MPKRTIEAKAPAAKKVKTVTPEAPILEFIGKCDDIPKACRELLQASVPFCLEVVESDRHKFQVEVLDRVAQLIAGVEHTKRGTVSEAEGALAVLNTDKDKAAVDADEKKAAADAKKAECDAKGAFVDAAREARNGSQKVLKAAQKEEADFNGKKAGLIAEQTNFNKLMSEGFGPLKDNTHQAKGVKRSKLIAELQKKLSELGAQDSLAEALATTLKMTAEKRAGTFAQATIGFAQENFNKHTAKVAQDISSLDAEEAALKATVAREESTVAEKKAAYEVVETEWNAMQDIWIGLDKSRAEAARGVKSVESQIPRAQKTIDKANADLGKFMELPTLFAQLKEKSTVVAEEPEPEEELDIWAAPEISVVEAEQPDDAMQAEA